MSGAGAASNRQSQRLRSIMQAFFEECCASAAAAERGRWTTDTAGATASDMGSSSGSGGVVVAGISAKDGGMTSSARAGRRGAGGEGFTERLHECAGFVAVISLLFQTLDEWDRCKHFIVVRMTITESQFFAVVNMIASRG